MGKVVLAVCVLLHFLFVAPVTWAKSNTAPVKQASAKKKAAAPQKAAKTARASKKEKQAKAARSRSHAQTGTARRVVHTYPARKANHARVAVRRAAPVLSAGTLAGLHLTDDPFDLHSGAALVFDLSTSSILFEKNSDAVLPIASITKLMTALVVIEAGQDLDEVLTVTADDIDRLKGTSSRLPVGSRLTRANMLHIALMSSENRAASALGRHYPGGLPAFVAAMNAKARELGMHDTRYVEPTGLSSDNVSTARDLAKLVVAAQRHPLIRAYSTNTEYAVDPGGQLLEYRNSNQLVREGDWDIMLQKTGYIAEAGRCLVMQTRIDGRPVVMVLLDAKASWGRMSDATRLRRWLENDGSQAAPAQLLAGSTEG